ncbi:MAG: helix-turn-helix domain-containing protein [Chitinophagales bacterium]|jgi:transcriptional regulator with XRE-family HTH domain|nr:helix-turn-helix transcriptional regulator [Sphingobacteriales bacterium]
MITLGEHLNILRKQKSISQGDLGKKIGTSGDIIGRYERDEVKPSIEVVIKLADALDVSIDYLVGKTDIELDTKSLQRIREITKLSDKNQEYIYVTLDALIRDFKNKEAYA